MPWGVSDTAWSSQRPLLCCSLSTPFSPSFSPSACPFFLFPLTGQGTEPKYIFYYSLYQLNFFLSVRCSKKYMSGMFPTFLLSCSKHRDTRTYTLARTHTRMHTPTQLDFSFLKEFSSNLFCQLLSIKNMKLHSHPHLHRSRGNFLDMSGQPACVQVPEQRVECAFCVQNMRGPDTRIEETQQTSTENRRKTGGCIARSMLWRKGGSKLRHGPQRGLD